MKQNEYPEKRIGQVIAEAQAVGKSLTTTRFFNYIPDDVYEKHFAYLCESGSQVLARENKKFIVDDSNEQVIRFLIHYFNRCRSAETIYPDKGYRLHRNIVLCGEVGAGKTILMQAFSLYLRKINSPMQFLNLSVGQMVNYYTKHNNLDKFTYNEDDSKAFQYAPINICLNDIGLDLTSFYGNDTKSLCSEFLFARSEIWQFYDKYCHLTTNLSATKLKEYFKDDYSRMNDRFKYFNMVHLSGESRR